MRQEMEYPCPGQRQNLPIVQIMFASTHQRLIQLLTEEASLFPLFFLNNAQNKPCLIETL